MTDLSFGATVLDANHTRFRLWAPALAEVGIEIDDRPAQPMVARGDGWFEAEAACGAGARPRRLPLRTCPAPRRSRRGSPRRHRPSTTV